LEGVFKRERADEYEAYNFENGRQTPYSEGSRCPVFSRGSRSGDRVRDNLLLGERRSHVAIHWG
jgi:hypothetical protein